MSAMGGVIQKLAMEPSEGIAQRMASALVHRGEQKEFYSIASNAVFFTANKNSGIFTASIYTEAQFTVIVDGREPVGGEESINFAHFLYRRFRELGSVGFLKELEGNFAVLIYRQDLGEVFIARDMYASRPLFYAIQDGNFWFASEVKAILADPLFQRSVNVRELSIQLTYRGNINSATLFENVYKVSPGFIYSGSVGCELNATLFLQVQRPPKENMGAEAYGKRIWSSLLQGTKNTFAGKSNLRSGVLLSGGIDSALVAMAHKEALSNRLVALSCGYGSRESDETLTAAASARACGVEFLNIDTTPDDDLLNIIRQVVAATDEPPRVFIAVPISKTFSAMDGKLDTIATGTFADILFGEKVQYDTPIYGVRKRLPNFLLGLIRRCLPIAAKIPKIKGYANWFKRGDVSSMKEYLLLNERVNGNLRGLLPACELSYCAPRIAELNAAMERVAIAAEDEYTLVDTLLYAHCWNELFEQIASHYGLDAIHPFQTQDLYRISLRMPYKGKIVRKFTKPYLRALAATLFSSELAYGEKKIFSSPGQTWLTESSELQEFVHQLADPLAKIGAYVNREALLEQLKEFNEKIKSRSLDQYTAQFIYTLIGLEVWLQHYFD